MSEQSETFATPAWESSKENVVPIKRGRSAKGLGEILTNDKDGKQIQDSLQESEFEKILIKQEAVPAQLLDAYVQYFKWVRDTFPTNSDKALKLLEVSDTEYCSFEVSQILKRNLTLIFPQRCTFSLKGEESVKNDHRFVKMWIEYVRLEILVVIVWFTDVRSFRLTWCAPRVRYSPSCSPTRLERGWRYSGLRGPSSRRSPTTTASQIRSFKKG